MSFQLNSKIQLLENETLARHVTFKIGGKALFYAEPISYVELCGIFEFSKDADLPLFVIGHGSNLLFSDEGFPGIVISMRSYERALFEIEGDLIRCSAGLALPELVKRAKENSRGGLEFLAWIPGTVGGAIVRNASYHVAGHKHACADQIVSVEVFDPRQKATRVLQRQDLCFEYRRCSGLDGIIIAATFLTNKKKPEVIDEIVSDGARHRSRHQDVAQPSVGCIFKNPDTSQYTAGQLIDLCGLKGKRSGDAQISKKHANFILNVGEASARDVRELITLAQESVKKKFNVDLELEVECVV